MKIAPLKVSDPWFGRIVNDEQVQADSLQSVPIESTVDMELVELLHAGPEGNYRPYLHLRGELVEARPVVELPYGVTELALRKGAGLSVDAFYDFNQQQLSDLVAKGYFSEAFKVPEQMSGIPWTLPGKADFLVVGPASSDEPPLVFMSVHEQNSLELDEANSGYELAGYFPDYSDQIEQATPETQTTEPLEHDGSGQDLFADVDFQLRPERLTAPAVDGRPDDVDLDMRATVPDGVFSRLVSEIQAKQPVEPEPTVDETEHESIVPGSAEDVYLSRVAPGVAHVLSGEHVKESEHEAEPVADDVHTEPTTEDEGQEKTPDGFLDLSEPEEEIVPLNVQFGEVTADDHRKVNDRRAARIRAELEADEASATGDEAQPVL
jgi:hypothetical protein